MLYTAHRLRRKKSRMTYEIIRPHSGREILIIIYAMYNIREHDECA